jgi:hypothetical protein
MNCRILRNNDLAGRRFIMRQYLLSDQDLDEIIWDLEYHLWLATEKLRDRFVHEPVIDEEDGLCERDAYDQKQKNVENEDVEF